MGIGISNAAAALWQGYDSSSYDENFIEVEGDYTFFTELPDWAFDPSEGPFYINDEGAIYAVSMKPSEDGYLIGNMT